MAEEQESMLAQGTKLRIAGLLAVAATAAFAAGVVTVTKTAHGLEAGSRVAVGGEHFAVTAVNADTFSYANPAGAAGALTYRELYDIAPKSFNGPGGSATVIDATTLSSVAKRKRSGLRDSGQVTFNVLHRNDNPAHTALRGAWNSGELVAIELEFEDGEIWFMRGLVLSYALSGSVDGLIEGAVSFEIDGAIEVLG